MNLNNEIFGLMDSPMGRDLLLVFVLVLCVFSCLVVCLEGLGKKFYRAKSQLPDGLYRSLEKAAGGNKSNQRPRLFVIPDPTPFAIVIKSCLGKGTILVSQGLVVSSTEEGLREVFKVCLNRLQDVGIVWASFKTLVLLMAWRLFPRTWGHFTPGSSLSSTSAVGYWIFRAFYPKISSFKGIFVDSYGQLVRGLVYLGRAR